jgi:hypothetical protein
MTYELIEFSEVNCDVYLDLEGLLDVTPIDPEKHYSFAYYEIDDSGNKEHCVWHSGDENNEIKDINEIGDEIQNLLEDRGFFAIKLIRDDNNDIRFDSNHKSNL